MVTFLWTQCRSEMSIITTVVLPISIIFGSVVLLQSDMILRCDDKRLCSVMLVSRAAVVRRHAVRCR